MPKSSSEQPSLLEPGHHQPRRISPVKHWYRSHRRAILQAYNRLIDAPLSSLLNIGVIAFALVIPLLLITLIQNASEQLHQWQPTPKMIVYLNPAITATQQQAIENHLTNQPDVQHTHYLSPQDGLATMAQDPTLAATIQALNNNPLPGTIEITLKSPRTRPSHIIALSNAIKQFTGVDAVQNNLIWIKRLFYLVDALSAITLLLSGLFLALLVLVIANTIRLEMQQHADEINVLQLIGANKRYISRPIIYHGVALGLIGFALALLLTTVALHDVKQPLNQLAMQYHTTLSLHMLTIKEVAFGFLCLFLLSYTSALMTCRHYLSRIFNQRRADT